MKKSPQFVIRHLSFVVATVFATANAAANSVAYWPLAYENGVRTTTATVFVNQGDGGTLDAVPSSRSGASWVSGTKTKAGQLCYGEGYAPVWIGASSSTTAFFNGQIDELRISRGILAPSEFLRRGTLPFVIVVK